MLAGCGDKGGADPQPDRAAFDKAFADDTAPVPMPSASIRGSELPMPDLSKTVPGLEPATPQIARSDQAAKVGAQADALIRQQWKRAENRASCAPIAFTGDAGASGTPRAANFAGGWAVAFDTPSERSAYGIAGTGIIAGDDAPAAEQARRLGAQWPYFLRLGSLRKPSFAGYGVEGARPYPSDNPEGYGINSLAYVRVGGQSCTYNVWSRLGRAHLESLLESLRML